MDGPTPNPDDKPRGGRKLKLTVDMAVAIAQAILDGSFRYQAGKLFQVGRTTFRRWMQLGREFPEGLYGQFRTLILESEAECERSAVKAILAAGKDDDPRHLEWWLERKYPQRWGKYRGEIVELRKELALLREAVARATADAEHSG